jgi:hypothetical protein
MPGCKNRSLKANLPRQVDLELPNDEIAFAVAKAIAEKMGADIVVSDCDGIELWTVRPKLTS